MQDGHLSSRFSKLNGQRSGFINRAVASASVTIPSLFPPVGFDGNSDLRTPSQSLGAKAVNSLAAKILLALLPPNQPFFRFTIDEEDLGEVEEKTKGEIEEALAALERMVLNEVEAKHARPVLHELIKQLLVAGNGLLFVGKADMKLYKLDKYVTKRDGMGKVREIVIEEPIERDDVPKHILSQLTALPDDDPNRTIKMYTQIKRMGNHWVAIQEINGILDPRSRTTYPLDKCPYLPLRMIRVDGEDYGRSYVEEYLGDLKSLEVLAKALNEGTTAAARVLFLVKANGTTKPRVLIEAPNGGFATGNPDDISVLQLEKQADFNQARQRMAEIKEDLSAAFLMNSSLTRNAERVTATEIRAMAQELETVLGGVYALLSVELQLPLVQLIMGQLQRNRKLPQMPDDMLKPQVLTGVAALGRSQELDKLRLLLELLAPLGPEVIAASIESDEYAKRVAAALSIDTAGLIPTPEQKQQREKSAQAKELMQMMGPQMMQGMNGNQAA
ncbi:portal protein [Amphritea sp. HPY]|uniref:portal protein n=1 Tax=Amphritea sp. HPY TaxID=3421652 RepID=UPI003D7CBFBA